jgi:prepilin-type N-terminal cleavage/methylation domain-containing protein
MNKNHIQTRKGFTLLEILLVIAAIGILAAIVLVAINPNRQLSQARNLVRQADINTIQKALEQYLIENGRYPTSVSTTPGYICNTGTEQTEVPATNCNERVDLRELVPNYIAAIPKDPQAAGSNTGYIVVTNPDNNRVSIQASLSERGVLAINPLSIVKDGLVLHLDAGNPASYPGTGTTWFDLSENNNNGNLINGVGYNNDNGGSLVFDGVNDYVDLGQSSSLFYPTEGLTVSAWVKTSVTDKWIIDNSRIAISQGWGFNCSGAGPADFLVNNLVSRVNTGITVCNTSNWMNLVGTWTPSISLLMYVNGIQVGANTISIPSSINLPDPIYNINIGRRGPANGTPRDYWNGNISQVSIYNRALTPDEIQQNFNATRGRFGL